VRCKKLLLQLVSDHGGDDKWLVRKLDVPPNLKISDTFRSEL
jgi:hypothetical protein